MSMKILVVGAGFAGSVCAERLASAGHKVTIVEKRSHIAGNAYDEFDHNGILIHRYGPHIFHTNSKKVFSYLSQFTDWRFYEHRVLASVRGQLLPIPINRTTINSLYSLQLDEAGVQNFLERVREPREGRNTSEDVVLSSVGSDLCDLFFRGYTKKQWGLDLSELSAGVAARIPTRSNDDDRYFTDDLQFMPALGYTAMFNRMLANEKIEIKLNVDFFEFDSSAFDLIIYTGPVDSYFKYEHGKLPYRSLRFEHEFIPSVEYTQGVGTVNFPNDHEYTRVTEFKHLTGQAASGTSVVREYPTDDGDPYYPIPRKENEERYQLYKRMTDLETRTVFVGRLAQYRYYNMDQVVAAALSAVDNILSGTRT